ncbi:hypothetical protein HZQ01_10555 [Elizabethkingia anophelis]|nr:hypothetical protein [Elizabethkingia anophelis]
MIFFGIYGYAQNHIKPAIGYLHVKDILSARIQKKVDELSKCPENKDKNIEVFCCGAKRDVYFKEGGVYLFRLFQNWSPASYYRIKVISKVTMSIYIDTDYSKYNVQ